MTVGRAIPNWYLKPKEGCEAHECEDALAVNEARQWFCIADGATEGFASRRWARLLTKHWARHRGPFETRAEFEIWSHRLGERFGERWERRKLSWFAEEKARLGAFAAFAALWFVESGDELRWKAVAIGDACVVAWRQNELAWSFPLDDPESFGFRPILLSSNSDAQKKAVDELHIQEGGALPGDVYFLLTDAIAAWFLRMTNRRPEEILRFERLLEAGVRADLDKFIESARSNGSLRNDDVGVIRVRIAS